MRYILIVNLFEDTNVDTTFYKFGQTLLLETGIIFFLG
jgi:hypothetical protein